MTEPWMGRRFHRRHRGTIMSTAEIIVGFVVSTLGFSFFIYGKKQVRPPQLILGMILMVCPFFATPVWTTGIAAAAIAGLWLAVRAGY